MWYACVFFTGSSRVPFKTIKNSISQNKSYTESFVVSDTTHFVKEFLTKQEALDYCIHNNGTENIF